MDYIFYSIGTTGDALPFIKLCAELNSKSCKTLYLCNEKFIPLAQSYGVNAQPVSSAEDYDRVYTNPSTWSSQYNHSHYVELHLLSIKATYKAIQLVVESGSRPFVVFQDVNSGARMACLEYGLSFCQVVLAPSSIFSVIDPAYPVCKQVPESLWKEKLPSIKDYGKIASFERLVIPFINPIRRELGLPEWGLNDVPQLEDSPSILALFPDWLKPNPNDWPKQITNTGFILGDSVTESNDCKIEQFIKRHGKPIVFSFGTGVPTDDFLISKLKKLCRTISKPGILIGQSNTETTLEDESSSLLVMKNARFSYLFANAALVVHHGGIGTCAQALAAGTPQLISPYTFDQPDNSYLLWRLGVGNSIDFFTASVDEIVVRMNELLQDSQVIAKCQNYAEKTADALGASTEFLLAFTSKE